MCISAAAAAGGGGGGREGDEADKGEEEKECPLLSSSSSSSSHSPSLSRIIMIEPVIENFSLIKANLRANGLPAAQEVAIEEAEEGGEGAEEKANRMLPTTMAAAVTMPNQKRPKRIDGTMPSSSSFAQNGLQIFAYRAAVAATGLEKNGHKTDKEKGGGDGTKARRKRMEITVYPNMTGNSTLHPKEKEECLISKMGPLKRACYTACARTQLCPVITLSEVIRRLDLKRIDLVKIDVEGAEEDVLRSIESKEDWGKIQAFVIETHNVSGRIGRITKMLANNRYDFRVCQDKDTVSSSASGKLATIRSLLNLNRNW
eukprot:jgi/Bigna1/136362/aug1.33_g11070